MASRRLEDLAPAMRSLAAQHVADCAKRGVELLIYCTRRSEQEQAQLFCLGRDRLAVSQKVTAMSKAGWPDLAAILEAENAKPRASTSGRVVTKAGPGESYHQHDLAYDCGPLVAGKLLSDVGATPWKVVLELGLKLGLESLAPFEYAHFQERGHSIQELMQRKYRRAA